MNVTMPLPSQSIAGARISGAVEGQIRRKSFGAPGVTVDHAGTERVGARLEKIPARLEKRDDAVASDALPSMAAGSPIGDGFAIGGELTRLAAALAFFRARSRPSTAACQIGRLRV